MASWLSGQLSKEGHQVALLSGEMVVEQRAAVIERFRDGKEKVLITTNVCARGKYTTSFTNNQIFTSLIEYAILIIRNITTPWPHLHLVF